MPSLADLLKSQQECCAQILKRLDKLDDILAAVRDLKGENDRLKGQVADLQNQEKALDLLLLLLGLAGSFGGGSGGGRGVCAVGAGA